MKRIAIALLAALPLAAPCESLYREDSYRPLVADNKAHRVGDILTVLVIENATAASSADTNTQRKQGLGVEYTDTLHTGRVLNGQINNNFDGRGTTERSGRLLAQISVRVTGIDAGGDLLVSGEQLLEINREAQRIKLDGRVRPQDVSDQNTIASTRIADARISYVGEGDVAQRSRPSWWHNFLTWIGL
jgi:flagellar L-ring protein precursor FlgH